MGKTRLGINAQGGGTLSLREIVATQSGGFTEFGIIGSLRFSIEHTEEEHHDDRGKLVDVVELLQKGMLEILAKQTRKTDIDTIVGSKGKYYSVFYTVQLRDGNYQHIFIPIVHISRVVGMTFGPEKREIPVKVHILEPLGSYAYPASFAQYQDLPLSIVDNAALLAAPTTSLPETDQHL